MDVICTILARDSLGIDHVSTHAQTFLQNIILPNLTLMIE